MAQARSWPPPASASACQDDHEHCTVGAALQKDYVLGYTAALLPLTGGRPSAEAHGVSCWAWVLAEMDCRLGAPDLNNRALLAPSTRFVPSCLS